jgi:hypothetical protein
VNEYRLAVDLEVLEQFLKTDGARRQQDTCLPTRIVNKNKTVATAIAQFFS